VVGQEPVLEKLLLAVLCRGHVLLEGVPGVGKTLAARSFAAAVKGRSTPIQMTPDLLPGDVTGTQVFLPDRGVFDPRLGPVVTNFRSAGTLTVAGAILEQVFQSAAQAALVQGPKAPIPTPSSFPEGPPW